MYPHKILATMSHLRSLASSWLFIAEQPRHHYAHELWTTHNIIESQHQVLAEIEEKLARRLEYGLRRKDKKRLQWSRAQSRRTIDQLETRRRWLLECLQQCQLLEQWYLKCGFDDASLPLGVYSTPATKEAWKHTNLNPEHVTHAPPWIWNEPETSARRTSSPFAPFADSGYGSSLCGNYDHHIQPCTVESHEGSTPWSNGAANGEATDTRTSESTCSSNEQATAPTVSKSPRYAENAIQLIESHLKAAKTHRRGFSLNDLRTGSD